jgi:hypothetical protein
VTVHEEPPPGVEAELRQAILRMSMQIEDTEHTAVVSADARAAEHETTAFIDSHRPPPPSPTHHHSLLIAVRAGIPSVVGGAILEAGPDFVPIDLALLEPIANVLADRQIRTARSGRLRTVGLMSHP